MNPKKKKSNESLGGHLRMSSAMLGAGPGALLDLPKDAVLVASLEHWGNPLKPQADFGRFTEISDPRLQGYVQRALDADGNVRLFQVAPADEDELDTQKNGLRAWSFPEWFVTREATDPKRSGEHQRSRYLVPRQRLNAKRRYELDAVEAKGKRRLLEAEVVPVRFVRACPQGHIEDIDWNRYAHPDRKPCNVPGALRLEERGTSGDIAEVFARCVACDAEQSLVRASDLNSAGGYGALGRCRGVELWKGRSRGGPCNDEHGKATAARLLVRSATNAWFPASLSAITVPNAEATRSELRRLVDTFWNEGLKAIWQLAAVELMRGGIDKIRDAFADYTDEALFAEVMKKRADDEAAAAKAASKKSNEPVGPKVAEVEAFFAVDTLAGEDAPGSEFYAERWPAPRRSTPSGGAFLDRVVAVHRLREVRALTGFTRFEAPVLDLEGDLDLTIGVRPAALASHKQWVPAVENFGEGLFFALDRERVAAWRARPAVQGRVEVLRRGFELWKDEKRVPAGRFFGEEFILLHSLSHLLITALSLECGYPSSSIRERIYSFPAEERYGLLLYTSSPDAEGTLGGLVATGRELERHLDRALELGRLCSNDPVCAHHAPDSVSGELRLQGAACHGCLLISETSCERQNTWLDRALVVPTVQASDAAFFAEWR